MGALDEARALLWENIEDSIWWFDVAADSNNEKSKEKINIQFHHYHPILVSFQIAFSGTVMELEKDDVHNILQYGAARRIGSIYAATKSFCGIVYPDRQEVLSQKEGRRLSDDLLLIYVHIVGVLDAFGIALHRLAGKGLNIAEKNSDILKRSFRIDTDFTSLESIFNDNDSWFGVSRRN
jgi:hypothetical protein